MSLYDRARIFFVNCTDASSTCTSLYPSEELIFGSVPGVCSPSDGVCICPPGYTGADLMAEWNDCHISANAMYNFELATLIIILVGTMVPAIGLIKMLHKWRIVQVGGTSDAEQLPMDPSLFMSSPPPPGSPQTSPPVSPALLDGSPEREETSLPVVAERRGSKEPPAAERRGSKEPEVRPPRRKSTVTVDLSSLRSPKTNAPTNAHKAKVAEVKRRQLTLLLVSLLFLHSASAAIYQAMRVVYRVRFEQTWWLQLIALSFSIDVLLLGLWLIIYLWWSHLPSLMLFARMFPRIKSNVLVRFPRFVELSSMFNCLLMVVAIIVFIFLLPMTSPELIPIAIIKGAQFTLAAAVISIMTILLAVCNLLLTLFDELRAKPFGDSLTTDSQFGGSVNTVRFVAAVALLAGVSSFAIACCMAFLPVFWRNYFVLFPVLLLAGQLVVVVATGIFAWRMK